MGSNSLEGQDGEKLRERNRNKAETEKTNEGEVRVFYNIDSSAVCKKGNLQ